MIATWVGESLPDRELENAKPSRRKAALRIGMPRERRSGEFECRYEIRGFGTAKRKRVFGADSVQARERALVAARAELRRLRKEARRFGEPALIGFPVMGGAYLPMKLVERVEKAVENIGASFCWGARKHFIRRK